MLTFNFLFYTFIPLYIYLFLNYFSFEILPYLFTQMYLLFFTHFVLHYQIRGICSSFFTLAVSVLFRAVTKVAVDFLS